MGIIEALSSKGLDDILVQNVLKDIDPQIDTEINCNIDRLHMLITSQHNTMRDNIAGHLQSAVGGSEPPNIPLCFTDEWTDNFAANRMLGECGFGQVYEGIYHSDDGSVYGRVAVKKLSSNRALNDAAQERRCTCLYQT